MSRFADPQRRFDLEATLNFTAKLTDAGTNDW